MLSSWTSRTAVLAFTTISACGVVALSPLLWSEPVVESAIADQPAASDCEDPAVGGVLFDPANPGSVTVTVADKVWAADTDGDGVRYELACYCEPATTCHTSAPGVFDEAIDTTVMSWETTFTDCDDDSIYAYGDDGTSGAGVELCDTLDNDCNGTIDDGAIATEVWYVDSDGDNFGDASTAFLACASAYGPNTAGATRTAGDCDDTDPAIHPGATEADDLIDSDCNDGANLMLPELCNGIDDNDDGVVDEGWPTGDWYVDADGDGFGDDQAVAVSFCLHGPVAGYANNNLDCDDTDPTAGGSLTEIVDNGLDDDCDAGGATTDVSAGASTDYRQDLDGDGYFDSTVAAITRSASGAAALADLGWYPVGGLVTGDCDDTQPLMNPAMAEIAFDGLDNDCGVDPASVDDGSATTEVCDGFDNDGDGVIDNGIAAAAPVADGVDDFFADLDNDGQGDIGRPIDCGTTPPPFPAVAAADPDATKDCDDLDADVREDVAIIESCGPAGMGDGRDNNCDGSADGGIALAGLSAEVEACDGIDNDCDGAIDEGQTLGDFYPDRDLDGNGLFESTPVQFCAAVAVVPLGYVDDTTPPTDCDDQYSGGSVALAYYTDGEGDGEGDENAVAEMSCTPVAGKVTNNTDCDDSDPTVGENQPEICDLQDNNCDGVTDEGAAAPVAYYTDFDGDGDGDENAVAEMACSPVAGKVTFNTDCDDDDGERVGLVGTTELCDAIDNNCDDVVDEGLNPVFWYLDADDDNSGIDTNDKFMACDDLDNPANPAPVLARANGFSKNLGDCDDDQPAAFPGNTNHLCDGINNDCLDGIGGSASVDGSTGIDDHNTPVPWYIDVDNDDHGDVNATPSYTACAALVGNPPGVSGDYSILNDDCNDTVDGLRKAGTSDLDTPMTNPGSFVPGAQIYPGATDAPYDDVDADCQEDNDYDVDGDGFASTAETVGDGVSVGDFDDVNDYMTSRSYQFSGEDFLTTDCDDNDSAIKPGVADPFDNSSVDQNCDGADGIDLDGDGYGAGTGPGQDCFDEDVASSPFFGKGLQPNEVRPNATDDLYDDIDENCDQFNDFDSDRDGYAAYEPTLVANATSLTAYLNSESFSCTGQYAVRAGETTTNCVANLPAEDCDESRNDVKPGAPDRADGVDGAVDNDCDGAPGVDLDGDLRATNASGGDDCDDTDSTIYSGAPEICDGKDNDCNTVIDDGGTEVCDGLDNDCDGQFDEQFIQAAFYEDADLDGYGVTSQRFVAKGDSRPAPTYCVDATIRNALNSSDQVVNAANELGDCNDGNVLVNPGENEVCGDGLDNDCDNNTPDSVPGGTGAGEIACNGIDDDCNELIDEVSDGNGGFTFPNTGTFYIDRDGDGYGDSNASTNPALGERFDACRFANVPGFSVTGTDCDDSNAAINPAAKEICDNGINEDCSVANNDSIGFSVEVCDGFDNNCGGAIDEGLPQAVFYVDADGDGYGSNVVYSHQGVAGVTDNRANPTYCIDAVIAGASPISGDCNDNNAAINPGAAEVCGDSIDNDCNFKIDNQPATMNNDGLVVEPGDICNGVDDDCNNVIDDGPGRILWYVDADRDGYGSLLDGSPELACAEADGSDFVGNARATNKTDCDDTRRDVNPAATEVPESGTPVDNNCDGSFGPSAEDICDGVDNDGDGEIDEDVFDPLTGVDLRVPFYTDKDGDGAGDINGTMILACSGQRVVGYGELTSPSMADCNDLDDRVYPGAVEVCEAGSDVDGVDNNCDGSLGGPEVCDGLDNDCNGIADNGLLTRPFYIDADGDGFGSSASNAQAGPFCVDAEIDGFSTINTDCDDRVASVSPGNVEVCDDGFDNNCDISSLGNLGADGGVEVCNGIDDDCDTVVDDIDNDPSAADTEVFVDADGDGEGNPGMSVMACLPESGEIDGFSTTGTDCNDNNELVNAGSTEICNGQDDNCSTTIDAIADVPPGDPSLVWYRDADGDGYGSPLNPVATCDIRAQLVSTNPRFMRDSRDCLDAGSSTTGRQVYAVVGDPNSGFASVGSNGLRPTKVLAAAQVNPGATEIWYDGIDQDCFDSFRPGSLADFDQDYDGQRCDGSVTWPEPACPPDFIGDDCVDAGSVESTVSDGAGGFVSIPANQIASPGRLPNPATGDLGVPDPNFTPVDNAIDGVNQTCRLDVNGNVADDFDRDGDGFSSEALVDALPSGYDYDALRAPPTDCEDDSSVEPLAPDINPLAEEVCGDGIDNNCVGGDGEFGSGPVAATAPSGVDVYTYYPDVDGDLYGDENIEAYACDPPDQSTDPAVLGVTDTSPTRYIVRGDDCDDSDEFISPDATELYYNKIIEDCDTRNDFDGDGDGLASTFRVLSAYGSNGAPLTRSEVAIMSPSQKAAAISAYQADASLKGWTALPATDCLDEIADLGAYPGYDGDAETILRNSHPARPAGPGVPEILAGVETCDLVDNDCDGLVDEDVQLVDYYPDRDGDGFGDVNASNEVINDCKPPAEFVGPPTNPPEDQVRFSYVANADDCYDDLADQATLGTTPLGTTFLPEQVHPDEPDEAPVDMTYDGYAQDCVERNDFDKDLDGFASTADVEAFDEDANVAYTDLYGPGVELPATDCDDDDFAIKPTYVNPNPVNGFAGDVVSNDSDDNCDGVPGVDADQDGVANEESGGNDCFDEPGQSRRGIPSDQIYGANTSPAPWNKPAAVDHPYNDVDENCDLRNDFDRDGDFQASTKKVSEFANATPGWDYLANSTSIVLGNYPATDCEDGENYLPPDPSTPTINNIPPRPTSVQGLWRYDELADSAQPSGAVVIYVQSATRRLRARDIRSGVTEVYYDRIDQNCDGINDFDQDEDGYIASDRLGTGSGDFVEQYNAAATTLNVDVYDPPTPDDVLFSEFTGPGLLGDCDDVDDETYPTAPDPPLNGKDNNCDGAFGVDGDNDGYASIDFGGTDCDDSNPLVNPGVLEVCEGGQSAQIDSDCDGNPNTSRGEYGRVRVAAGTTGFNADTLTTALIDDPSTPGINLIEVPNIINGVISTPFFRDSDGDTFGNAPIIGTEDLVEGRVTNDFFLCGTPSPAEALTADSTDCDDSDATVNPEPTNLELCNGKDDNCNGEQDEPIIGGAQLANSTLFYRDHDADGYGTPESTTLAVCNGYLSSRVDINDRIACGNGQFPEPEYDNDGNLIPSSVAAYGIRFPALNGQCYGTFQNDCNDSDATIHPDLPGAERFEILDGRDNNCDGRLPIVEADCDDDSQMPLLPIPASQFGPEGVFSGPVSSVAQLNELAGVPGLVDGVPTENSEGYGLQPCVTFDSDGSPIFAQAPRVSCLGDFRNLACDADTGFWTMNAASLDAEQFQDGIRINAEANDCDQLGDCDDRSANRCAGRAERCDGVDNNCADATSLFVHLDTNKNGLPDHMEVDAVTPGWVNEQEMDFDGDGFLECVLDEPNDLDKGQVSLRGGRPYTTVGGDCNNTCSILNPNYEGDLCAGLQGSCDLLNLGDDADNDGYMACGPYAGDNESEETLFVLSYAEQIVTPTPSAPEEEWNVVPLVMPRRMLSPQGADTDEPMACDTAHFEALNELLGVENVLALEEDESGDMVPAYDVGDLLGTCVLVDQCLEAQEADPNNLPDYCPEDLSKIRCVVTKLTAPATVDSGVFDQDLPGCLEADGGAWWPEQVVFRSVWSRERIVEARRVVTEWDCYRHTGEFGCGSPDITPPSFYEPLPSPAPAIESGGFRADTTGFRNMQDSQLRSDPELQLMFNRFLPTVETSGLLLGCWGDTSRGVPALGRIFQDVGGDCADADPPEGERSRDGALDAQNRGHFEGPDDLLALFEGRVVDCDVCSDGLDNNCNGKADCLEPACARCYVGQSSGGCGADACTVGGCSSTSTGGIQSTGALSLLMLMLGMGWRRRREDDDAAA